jgi:dTDP-4-dehydrorhamnose 3,5-epimerase
MPDVSCRRGSLHGLLVLERPTFEDERGYFHEAFRLRDLEEFLGRSVKFVQINHSRSRKDVLRGLHAENWEKLVYVPYGEVFTALADIRPWSPTFGQIETFRFSDDHRPTLFLPAGIAHGYCVLSDTADYVYQVTSYYDGSDTRAVAWDDPDLAVRWPTDAPIVSERDRRNPTLRRLVPEAFQGDDAATLVGVALPNGHIASQTNGHGTGGPNGHSNIWTVGEQQL